MQYECKRCGWQWVTRLPDGEEPRVCSRCKSYKWKSEKTVVNKKGKT
jgi:predicted Zn-ribbon and HTH transcriptional regulator